MAQNGDNERGYVTRRMLGSAPKPSQAPASLHTRDRAIWEAEKKLAQAAKEEREKMNKVLRDPETALEAAKRRRARHNMLKKVETQIRRVGRLLDSMNRDFQKSLSPPLPPSSYSPIPHPPPPPPLSPIAVRKRRVMAEPEEIAADLGLTDEEFDLLMGSNGDSLTEDPIHYLSDDEVDVSVPSAGDRPPEFEVLDSDGESAAPSGNDDDEAAAAEAALEYLFDHSNVHSFAPPPDHVLPSIRSDILRDLLKFGIIVQDDERDFFLPMRFAELERDVHLPVGNDSDHAIEGVPAELRRWMRLLLRLDPPGVGMADPVVLNSDGSISIPFKKLYNLKTSMLFYLMHCISEKAPGTYSVFATGSALDKGFKNPPRTFIGQLDTRPHDKDRCFDIAIVHEHIKTNDYVPWQTIIDMFANCLSMFEGVIHQNFGSGHWNHANTFISGDYLNVKDANAVLRFQLFLQPLHSFYAATSWDERLREALCSTFPHGIAFRTVTNHDPYCLAYSLVLAFGLLEDPGIILSSERFVSELSLSTLVLLNNPDRHPKAQYLMMNFDKLRMPLEGKWEHMYNTSEFIEFMKTYEELVIPEDWATPVDVYMINVLTCEPFKASHIFPVYMSRRSGGKRVSLLSVNTSEINHFCVITDLNAAFKQTESKIFYNCSTCHKAFFSQSLLKRHVCHAVPGVGEYEWSDPLNHAPGTDDGRPPFGICKRCHLQFSDEARYLYHKKHCMMKFRTGNKQVRLPANAVMSAEDIPEDEDLSSNYLMFADFECCIRPDGEHSFMSYGLYDPVTCKYESGFSLESFMKKIIRVAAAHYNTTVYFHNAMNYDANFILRYVLQHNPHFTYTTPLAPSVIMESLNRLKKLSFHFRNLDSHSGSVRKLHIGDTFMFLTLSLDRIVSSVRKETTPENMNVFPQFFASFKEKYPFVTFDDINMILKKNLFPYKFFDDPKRLDTPIGEFLKIFCPIEENLKYFSETVTVASLAEQYDFVRNVIETFKLEDARDYHDLYLRCDVLQITDVFMAARRAIHDTHHIDLAKYPGMPSASWHAFLRHDQSLILPLYTDTRFAEFFAHMTRGGVTSAPLRHAIANSTHSILYLDVNGLYPFVMGKYPYPCGDFEWIEIALLGIPDAHEHPHTWLYNVYFAKLEETGRGACLEVDLHITDEVKLLTDQYPFAPEHRTLFEEYFDAQGQLRPFLKQWSEVNEGEPVKPFTGLVGTLFDKKEYGVHWRLLKYYMDHGVQVTKVHRIVEFDEGYYLRDYVNLNISLRNNRKDELGKMVYKLMGNSVYGKTFESPFNHGKFLIVRNQDKLTGLLEEGNVASINPIDENNTVVKMDGEQIELDKPTYIGACVTEYAKLHMYQILYDELPKMFPRGVELVYTDTDSFIVRVEHEPDMSAEQIFARIRQVNPDFLGSKGGQLKSETGEDLIDEVIALRSKVYAYRTKGGYVGKRAKGTTAAAQTTQLDWESYKQALFELRAIPTHNSQFVRRQFSIKTTDLLKKSLTVNDGKRNIEPDGIHTHAFGF